MSEPHLPPHRLRLAAATIRSGGVVAYPTEAVYGLGCDPLNPEAVLRLLAMKRRSPDKGVILIAADFAQLRPFVEPVAEPAMTEVLASWPGPNTWILPARSGTPSLLTGDHDGLAVRVTGHPLAATLCRAAGMALVSTSANRAGRAPARTCLQVRMRLDASPDYLLCGPVGARSTPSRIRDARSGRLVRG